MILCITPLVPNDNIKLINFSKPMVQCTSGTLQEGIGKPGLLKHGLSGYWSRRINDEHRIVYKHQGGAILIAQPRYDYSTQQLIIDTSQ